MPLLKPDNSSTSSLRRLLQRGLITLALAGVLVGTVAVPETVRAQTAIDNMFTRLDRISQVYGQPDLGNQDTRAIFIDRVGRVVRIFLSLLGLIMIILIMYAGYLWLTARGNEQQVEDAKHTLRSAIIGAIIILSAYAITGFLIYNVERALGII